MEIILRGTRLNIEMTGKQANDRPALVFVHGAGGDASIWMHQARWLSADYLVCRVELPGHGGSGGEGETSIRAYAGWVMEAVREIIGEKPYILAGHSMGGAIALDLAIQGQDGLAGLILVSTGAKLGVTPVVFRLLKEDFQGFIKTIDRTALGPNASGEARQVVENGLRRCSASVIHGDFTACSLFDVRGNLGVIRIPTLVVCGEKDLLSPVSYSEFLANNIPGALLDTVPQAGHMVMLESPERVNRAMERYLNEAVSLFDSKRRTSQCGEGNNRLPGTGA